MAPLVFNPEDFKDVDWNKVDASAATGLIKLVNSMSDEDLKNLGIRVDEFVATEERKRAILNWVQFALKVGLRFVGV